MIRPGRLGRLLLALLAVLAVAAPGLATPAHAATDQVDSYSIDYVVNTDGTVDVTEELVYRFGEAGRRGIERYLVTREPEADDQRTDIAYEYNDINVTSPDAPDQFVTSLVSGTAARTEYLRIRVGDPNLTVSGPTATYVLSYTITGALRSQDSYDEFYWDATGFEWENTTLRNVDITVTVPEGATDQACYVGAPRSTRPCDSSTLTGGVLTARQGIVQPGEGVSVAAQIRPGLISNNTPVLVPSEQVQQQRRLATAGGLTAASAVASTLVGAMLVRSRRDQRYLDLPPGVIPPRGQEGRVGPAPRDIEVPVAFSPPPISVAEAGLLMDGRLEPRETAATLIDMAVHGVFKVSGEQRSGYTLTLVDPYAVRAPHEAVLVQTLFPRLRPGTSVHLGTAGEMTAAHDSMVASVRRQVSQHGWFTRVPGGGPAVHVSGFSRGGFGLFAMLAVLLGSGLLSNLVLLLPVIPIVIVALVVRSRLKRGQRTALGRALTDQGEGFREYLATAEADQIRFEEGEDIFSKYLPWAISFGLADRWAAICRQLVEAGRIPDVQPDWFYGPFYLNTFSWYAFTDAVGSTVAPAVDLSGAGTGFGSGGSAFGGGGGFAGGGGGGGGGGSW